MGDQPLDGWDALLNFKRDRKPGLYLDYLDKALRNFPDLIKKLCLLLVQKEISIRPWLVMGYCPCADLPGADFSACAGCNDMTVANGKLFQTTIINRLHKLEKLLISRIELFECHFLSIVIVCRHGDNVCWKWQKWFLRQIFAIFRQMINAQLEVSRKSENYPLVEEFFDKSSFCLRILGYLDGYALIYKELRWIMLSNDLQEILI